MDFIIHAAGSLRNRPDLGKKAYRLHCKFSIGNHPRPEFLKKATYAAADRFVVDMHKQGWEYVEKFGWDRTGPFPAMRAVALPKRVRVPSAREMLAGVKQGNPYRAQAFYGVQSVPLINESEDWEYRLAGVFVHKTILTEYPDRHEEIRA